MYIVKEIVLCQRKPCRFCEGRDLEKEGEFMFYNFPPDYDEAGHQGTIIWSVLSCWLLGSSADMLELLGMVGMIFSAEFSVA